MQVNISEILFFLERKGIEHRFLGNRSANIVGYSSITHYKPGTITWAKNAKAIQENLQSAITLLVLPDNLLSEAENCIYCRDAKSCFFSIVDELLDIPRKEASIGEGTIISPKVQLGKDVVIGSNCVLNGAIKIGNGTHIGNGVVISNKVTIGENCTIQSLTVIGEDGFGYFDGNDGIRHMIRHHGGVSIGNDVFIGSHVNIARGTLDDTWIGNNVKIAPSTHIGHNNVIEDNATIICSRLYGSCHVEENSYLTSCTVKNQLTVGRDALVGMGAVVTKNVETNQVVVGIPAKPIKSRY